MLEIYTIWYARGRYYSVPLPSVICLQSICKRGGIIEHTEDKCLNSSRQKIIELIGAVLSFVYNKDEHINIV